MILSVLIADDERWMREAIARSIDWDQHGFRIIGKAIDGLQAFEMIQDQKPDIVLADIKMPGMDGITLLRKSKATFPDTAFIFFSGYDKFEYAKDAINLGALGYLLKPVDEHELLDILLKARTLVESANQHREGKILLDHLSEKDYDRRRNDMLKKFFEGTPQVSNSLTASGISFGSDSFIVISLDIGEGTGIVSEDAVRKHPKDLIALNTICLDYFERAGIKTYAINEQNGVAVLLNLNDGNDYPDIHLISEICITITETYRNSFGQPVSIGIGCEVSGIENIHQSYLASHKALEYTLLRGAGKVIDYKNISKIKSETVILNGVFEKKITDGFEKADFALSEKVIDYIQSIIKDKELSTEDIKNFNYGLIELVYRILNRSDIHTETCCPNPHILCEQMNRCTDIAMLFSEYRTLINAGLQLFASRNLNYRTRLTDSIKQHIHEHYHEDINLESVAQTFCFHPNYISKLFKTEFNETFIDYITRYRIDKAKIFLKDVKNNIVDVAIMVGYKDPKYFSKVFKKVTGITPGEYIGKR